ncbi:MAG: DUF4422 domain-containing protein [Butyrivibrio sp.]|nr:DUF4422 domain-containing protein [Butyrivibrio sp.]
MKKHLVIYVSTFGRCCIHTSNAVPIEVGAKNRKNFIYKCRDDNGDNISAENEYYGELTGLYYIWKNVNPDSYDYIGFSHYNKKLKVSKKQIIHYLTDNQGGWIVASRRRIPPHSDINEWKIFCEVICEKYPEYCNSLFKIYSDDGSSNSCNPANMFITSKEEFTKYCKFVFGVCAELRLRIGNNQKPKYHKRYCAFLSERLLSIYLDTWNRNARETKMQYSRRMIVAKIVAEKTRRYKGTKIYDICKRKLSKYLSISSYRN